MFLGGSVLLDGVNLNIEKGERICLLGRNGAGKSTLMKILDGRLEADDGSVIRQPGASVSYFTQTIPRGLTGTVFEVIARGLGRRGVLMLKYHVEEQRIADADHADHSALNKLHDELDVVNGWSTLEEVGRIATKMSLDLDWDYEVLSGGQKRRVLLAAALVSEPDMLLLDEPTNHMDIDSIAWLEECLLTHSGTVLFVTHDRLLLRRLATRIIELDRGQLADWTCDYDTFLQRKQTLLEAQEKEWHKFDKKLSQEETWIRRGIQGRRTRNEGRVRALVNMREEREQRRLRAGSVTLRCSEAQKSGTMVIEAKKVSFGYGDTLLIDRFDALITRGDKVGIIGPNGCGKTTLVNLLLGKKSPQSGHIRRGTQLAITYFDQLREQLDEDETVWKNVLPNGETVHIGDKHKHIIAYLEDFLFSSERAKTRVRFLSGGERNRLLLAKLFTKPSNLLVLDEPTNDLDAETLELLEALLVQFSGTVLLICHDRVFLDNVVTNMLVFEGQGRIGDYVGGYHDWSQQEQATTSMPPAQEGRKGDKKKQYRAARKAKQPRRLTYNETRELDALPSQIEAMESEQTDLHEKMADPEFYKREDEVVATSRREAELQTQLAEAYMRWEALEKIHSQM